MILKILLVIIGVFLGLVGSGFCQSAKARDTITMTLEDYEHMGEILHSLPIRERHKSLKGKDVALYRCPKCKSYVAEWTEVCECGKISFVNSGSLTSGRIKSCGCLRKPHEIEQGKRLAKESKKQCIDGTSIRSITMKKPKTNTSGIKGVYWDKNRNKWVAQIEFKGKTYYLGRYANKEDAREAREKAEKEMFGKFLEEHKEYVKDKRH